MKTNHLINFVDLNPRDNHNSTEHIENLSSYQDEEGKIALEKDHVTIVGDIKVEYNQDEPITSQEPCILFNTPRKSGYMSPREWVGKKNKEFRESKKYKFIK